MELSRDALIIFFIKNVNDMCFDLIQPTAYFKTLKSVLNNQNLLDPQKPLSLTLVKVQMRGRRSEIIVFLNYTKKLSFIKYCSF